MAKVLKRPRARIDLAEIWDYIADDSEKNADDFLSVIDDKIARLAMQPLMGRARPELAPLLRSFAVRRYVIFYLPLTDGIEIVRVLHSARDIEGLFAADN